MNRQNDEYLVIPNTGEQFSAFHSTQTKNFANPNIPLGISLGGLPNETTIVNPSSFYQAPLKREGETCKLHNECYGLCNMGKCIENLNVKIKREENQQPTFNSSRFSYMNPYSLDQMKIIR